ncbi:MAG TPA: MFS transporter, partial [Candidatus Acidoferrum sp.]|nr:MFS transporter [Candidatus Acidoferrum sp.]
MSTPQIASEPRLLVPSLLFIALVVAAVGSLGAPLITSVASTFGVSLDGAQWTQTITLLSGAIVTPVLGRMGAGPRRRGTILATLAVVVVGSALTVLPLSFVWLLVGRAAQGVGLGLTALMMGLARDHLPENRGGIHYRPGVGSVHYRYRRRLPARWSAHRPRGRERRLWARAIRHR